MITLELRLGEPGSPFGGFLNPIELTITPTFTWEDSTAYTSLAGTAVHTSGGSITSVEYKVNDGSYANVSTIALPNWSNSTTTLEEGSNTITVRATDSEGQTSEATLLISVDTTAPVVNLGDDVQNEGTGYSVLLQKDSEWIEVNPDTVRYKIEGGSLPGTWVTWDAPYNDTTISVPAEEEEFIITLEVTDLAGNVTTDTKTFSVVQEPEGVSFDGENDYLSRSTDLVGNTDSKTFTFSCWVYNSSIIEGNQFIYSGLDGFNNSTFDVTINNSNKLELSGRSSGTKILGSIGVADIPLDTWVHLLASGNNNSNVLIVYINDSLKDATDIYSSTSDIDFGQAVKHGIGSSPYNWSNNLGGRLAHLFLDYTYRDLSIEANRRLFITEDLKPADGLADLSPILYLPMKDAATAHINEGTGGDFTQNDTLDTAPRGPNQWNCVASEFDGVDDYLSGYYSSSGSQFTTFSVNINSYDMFDSYGFGVINHRDSGTKKGVYCYISYGKISFLLEDSSRNDLCKIGILNIEANTSNSINISYDGSNASIIIVLNGKTLYPVTDYTIDTLITGTVHFSNMSVLVGDVDTSSSGRLNGTLGELYLDTTYIDLSTSNPFWDSDLNKPKPVRQVLEETGNTPLIAMPISADNPGLNLGSGGDFTVNGGPLVGAIGASEDAV